jgi:hypothetical protein
LGRYHLQPSETFVQIRGEKFPQIGAWILPQPM